MPYADPPPAPSGYIISFGEAAVATATVSFNFTWDPSFNSRYGITSYRVVPTNNDMVECPSSCHPDVPCRCIGLSVRDQVQVNISAVNCGDQEGPVRSITVASCEFKYRIATEGENGHHWGFFGIFNIQILDKWLS